MIILRSFIQSYLAKRSISMYNPPVLADHPILRMEKGLCMERRAASHTEEEEMNQRRRLLNLARKGDPKAISRLFELYQVKVYSGETLNKTRKSSPAAHQKMKNTAGKRLRTRPSRSRHAARKSARKVAHRVRSR
jgi:hypothetical protein